MCLFVCVCVFSEFYGLYLNKTVGWEQSILLVCVCVILCLRGPIQILKARHLGLHKSWFS